MSDVLPLAIDLAPERLQLTWPDGAAELSAGTLRAACRCGTCRGRAVRGEPLTPELVTLTGASPIGQYAVQLIFSDGHDRGIYPWALLHELSTESATR